MYTKLQSLVFNVRASHCTILYQSYHHQHTVHMPQPLYVVLCSMLKLSKYRIRHGVTLLDATSIEPFRSFLRQWYPINPRSQDILPTAMHIFQAASPNVNLDTLVLLGLSQSRLDADINIVQMCDAF